MTNQQLAFVFPGQGSQKVGMLAAVAAANPVVEESFAEASEVLGYDLWQLAQQGPQEAQNLTERTQPLLLAASVALWRVWQQRSSVRPSLLAGHSLGEFSALVCAGSLAFVDAVKLVRARGQFMQSAVPVGVGAMAAVLGMEDQQIVDICAEVSRPGAVVEAVNFNSPGQVVIAGHAGAVEQGIERLKAAGCKRAMPLPVSAPFHTSLMVPAGEQLAQVLEGIELKAPVIPVVHNVHAQAESDPGRIRELLIQQISSPVKWTGCVQFMVAKGIATTVECGPGRVLSGLNKRVDKSLNCLGIDEVDGLEQALAALS